MLSTDFGRVGGLQPAVSTDLLLVATLRSLPWTGDRTIPIDLAQYLSSGGSRYTA